MSVVSVYSIGMMCMCDAMLLRGRNGSADGSRVCWCLCLRMCYLQAVPCAVNRSPVVCSHTQTHTSHMCTVDRGCGKRDDSLEISSVRTPTCVCACTGLVV